MGAAVCRVISHLDDQSNRVGDLLSLGGKVKRLEAVSKLDQSRALSSSGSVPTEIFSPQNPSPSVPPNVEENCKFPSSAQLSGSNTALLP